MQLISKCAIPLVTAVRDRRVEGGGGRQAVGEEEGEEEEEEVVVLLGKLANDSNERSVLVF